jgi:hypothetical protein
VGRGRKITRTHCIDCRVKLTDENRYKSVKSRCKTCHIKKVTGNDKYTPPKAPSCVACIKGRHRCRGCGTVVPHGTKLCETCTDQPQVDPLPPMLTPSFLMEQYKRNGIEEHLPAALAEVRSSTRIPTRESPL